MLKFLKKILIEQEKNALQKEFQKKEEELQAREEELKVKLQKTQNLKEQLNKRENNLAQIWDKFSNMHSFFIKKWNRKDDDYLYSEGPYWTYDMIMDKFNSLGHEFHEIIHKMKDKAIEHQNNIWNENAKDVVFSRGYLACLNDIQQVGVDMNKIMDGEYKPFMASLEQVHQETIKIKEEMDKLTQPMIEDNSDESSEK